MTLEPAENGIPHTLYDLSIENIEERRAQAITLRTAKDAANYIGVPPNKIFDVRRPGKTIFSPIHDRRFAVRVAKLETA